MDQISKAYVQLVLALGRHDANYVDAYYGPEEWRPEETMPLAEIRDRAERVRSEITGTSSSRGVFLSKQLSALIARVDLLSGVEMSFDEESSALYDVTEAARPDSYYADIVRSLDPLLPGSGTLAERFDVLRGQFSIPKDRLESVFSAAIDAARDRTRRHLELPSGEDFRIEYVSGEVWSAYNWYQGKAHSLIQVNTDFPMSIDRAIGLACHEGYPGHHVYNALLEQHLVRDRGWLEFTVYPLYSPQSLIAEGTAEYGVELTYPSEDRLAFEKETLYPLAGLDVSRANEYSSVLRLAGGLGYASTDAARRYLNGEATRSETVEWLVEYSLSTPARADQRVRFIEAHRSYIVTYVAGLDLVRAHVSGQADRWKVFEYLLTTPQTPSGLGKN